MGEPGVGKTALAYGLAARIEAGNVPERLTGCRIYELDLGNLLAGTQYRGEFEKRLKAIMEGIRKEGHAIVYIDEIHNLIGAGRTGDGSMDASNMLKPYLEGGRSGLSVPPLTKNSTAIFHAAEDWYGVSNRLTYRNRH